MVLDSCLYPPNLFFPLEKAASELTPPVIISDQSSQLPQEVRAEEPPGNSSDKQQLDTEPSQTPEDPAGEEPAPAPDIASSEPLPEASPIEDLVTEKEDIEEPEVAPETKEEPTDGSSTNPESDSDDKSEAVSVAEEPAAVATEPFSSAAPNSAGSDDSSQSQGSEGNI